MKDYYEKHLNLQILKQEQNEKISINQLLGTKLKITTSKQIKNKMASPLHIVFIYPLSYFQRGISSFIGMFMLYSRVVDTWVKLLSSLR